MLWTGEAIEKPASGSDPKAVDRSLIDRCIAGDATAWETLLDRYGRLIYSVSAKYRLHDADADDVFQAVCVTMLQKLDTLVEHQRLTSWIAAIAHRKCLDVVESQRRRVISDVDDEETANEIRDRDPLPDETIVELELQHELRTAVSRLPERCRRLIQALYYDRGSPSYADVARKLGIPANSLGPTRARCLVRLREIVGEIDFEGAIDV